MDAAERERYSRQIRFSGIGEPGQEILLRARVVIVGCGALGSFHGAALARAGVGSITLIDRDYVEPSNLQRQWLFEESDAADGLPKAVAAERCLARINSSVRAHGVVADLTSSNVEELLGQSHLILDGTDNFETRYLINDFAVCRGIPWIYGAAVGSYGLAMPVLPGHTACLRCVYPDPPEGAQPTCETAGVLNVITSLVASYQVADALKILCGRQDLVQPRITTVDIWQGGTRQIDAPPRDPDCPACGRRQFPYLEESLRAPVRLCGRNAVQVQERVLVLDLAELKTRLEPIGEVRANEFALRFIVAPYEMTVFPDGRAIIKGTSDTGVARSLYARYFG
ncbi:MAG: ThiF family adenylyltransferase [Acidobacteriia bacterium]|nr:ThiF family adenylyltransferase [Terriglobia bacterium]